MINNNISSYQTLTEYNNDQTRMYPNVSYIVATDEVKWVKEDPTLIVAKYNVTSTSNTNLLYDDATVRSKFYSMEIDGVLQPEVVSKYQFDTTGEHTVKYKLVDITEIPQQAFYWITKLKSIVIPEGVLSIGVNAFPMGGGACELTSVSLPSTLTRIKQGAFSQQTALTEIVIPDSVTQLDGGAFVNSTGLLNVTIGSGITNIANQAFQNCSNLTSITIKATTPPSIYVFFGSTNVFENTNNCPIYVPAESVTAYQTASGWSTYASRIQAIPTT